MAVVEFLGPVVRKVNQVFSPSGYTTTRSIEAGGVSRTMTHSYDRTTGVSHWSRQISSPGGTYSRSWSGVGPARWRSPVGGFRPFGAYGMRSAFFRPFRACGSFFYRPFHAFTGWFRPAFSALRFW